MSVTWLHISDLHVRSGDPYDRDVVLRALVASAERFHEKGRRPDLIFVTGDVAYSGKAEEYEPAGTFFDALLEAVELDKDRLYVVPGNHDVDRSLGVGLARTLQSREQADAYFAPGIPKPHLTQKQGAFLNWFNSYFLGIRSMPEDATCGPVELADIRGFTIGILPLNSALFAQDENDHEKLWIGRRCLDTAMKEIQGLNARVNVALLHHPLDWLHGSERSNIKGQLRSGVEFILRGHLHETEVESVASVSGQALHMAAGAAYQTRRWPNRAVYVTIDGESATVFPIRYEDQPQEVWTLDASVFPGEDDHQGRFPIPSLSAATAARSVDATRMPTVPVAVPRFRSNIPSRMNLPFVGRDDLIEEIGKRLGEPSGECVLVLHGHSGTGKSELAREFARLQDDRYPGGTFFIDARQGVPFVDLARIGKNILDLEFPPDLPLQDQCLQTLHTLGMQPALLIYDNALSPDSISPWLPPSGMPCHILITTVFECWPLGWATLEVPPLTHAASLELIVKLAGTEVAGRFGEELASLAKGLPIQICPAAASLAYDQRRGRLDSARLTLSSEAEKSFRGVYDRLEPSTRLVLHAAALLNGDRILRQELLGPIKEAIRWSDRELQRELDACMDLHILQGTQEFRMHQLLASFVLESTIAQRQQADLTNVRRVQAQTLVQLAVEVAADPGNPEFASKFMVFPFHPDAWSSVGIDVSTPEGETLGLALYKIGRFDNALPWFERAVAAKEKGDEDGRVDHQSLGNTLHDIGDCLWSMGRFEKALPWFKRAVQAKQKGDLGGRADYSSIGRSLHQVGDCLSSMGEFEDALTWFERAVETKEKGDVRSRVDHDSLGESLHQVGYYFSSKGCFEDALQWYERAVQAKEIGDLDEQVDYESLGRSMLQVGNCLSRMGRFLLALPWYERAVQAAEKGDVYGRVDHVSLGRCLHQVGHCLVSMGQFDDALGWFEKAVQAEKKGDVYGRMDHASLGRSLNNVGYCLGNIGRFEDALQWFEQAVQIKEKGDVYGRQNHESLGVSLHKAGDCLGSMERYEEALHWYERAVDAKQKGDVHGCVDYASLGRSLHQVCSCLLRIGRIDDALPCCERALAAKEKGDAHGRIDYASLGLSLHLMGSGLLNTGRCEEALHMYERAVEAKGKGNVHGQVDHESLGRSLHSVGSSLDHMGRYQEALGWYERAIAAKRKGDLFTRVDHRSLAESLRDGAECLRKLERLDEANEWEEAVSRFDLQNAR